MAPMSIHTVAPAKTTYIRIVRSDGISAGAERFVGRVGILTAVAKNEEEWGNLCFVAFPDAPMPNMFKEKNIEEISKKEYFKGCLGG